ncbi:MAG: cadmium-translocating P-type ATPase [Firmicutes bacterium]|nr:cadmium-translocating P-type ATPase [Bacillota bacterium]HOB22118.1 heavy metal translocating P-type ATPase [Bacillota bacterium]HQD40754.1 heavy metal translocating P-type ATPase [Bacillota bacterium]
MQKARFQLEGLDCANCALKIEQALQNTEGFNEAKVNFAAATLEIDPDQLEHAQRIISSLEPDVRVASKPQAEAGGFLSFIREEQAALKRILLTLALILLGYIAETQFQQVVLGNLFLLFAYLAVGGGVLKQAARNVFRGELFDENALMSIATLGAIAIGQIPEAIAVMLFYFIGEMLQDHAVKRSRSAISSLVQLRPEEVWVREGDELRRASPEEVQLGQEIVVKAGERIPLDGVVVEGETFVDTSVLTGESVPRRLSPGDTALAGMVNTEGLLVIKTTKPFGESAIARILALVEEAASRKAKTEKMITSFSRYYTPTVVALAAAVAILPPLVFGASFSTWLYRALVLLVISCPCALVVSVPLGYFGGLGRASKEGILVKGANYLDVLSKLDAVAFDKTGTLTEASFQVTEIHPANGFTPQEVLEPAAKLEAASNHPIAKAIITSYGQDVDPLAISDYQEVPGFGIKGTIAGEQVILGTDKFMHKEGIPHSDAFCETVGTTVHVTVAGQYRGYLIVADRIKPQSAQAIRELRQLGIEKLVMLSGDDESVAVNVGRELGLDEVHAELLPEDKVEKLEELRRGRILAFVGDGINDAPVLSRADVGIAMGGLGSDAAIEAADVVIMDDNLSKLSRGIRVARKTRRIVSQNIIFALGVKSLFMLLGLFGISGIWLAVFADVGVTLLAILNSLRTLHL